MNENKKTVDSLVENNTRLVWNIVKRFYGRGYDAEDLYQTGCVGLVKAAKKFDPSLGLQFSTYAVPVITGEILQMMRDNTMIKVSRSLKTLARDVRHAIAELEGKFGYSPAISQIAEFMNLPEEKIIEAISASNTVYSIDATCNSSGESEQNDGGGLIATLEKEGWGSERDMLNKVHISEILGSLGAKERQLLVSRYILGKTQAEIAEDFGMTQVAVSRLEKKIKEQLKDEY